MIDIDANPAGLASSSYQFRSNESGPNNQRGLVPSRGQSHRWRNRAQVALSISPGPIKTPFQSAAQSSPELIKQFLSDVPMQRFGEPEEIGELVLFICSDACEFMTADTIYVNVGGGWR